MQNYVEKTTQNYTKQSFKAPKCTSSNGVTKLSLAWTYMLDSFPFGESQQELYIWLC